MNHLQVKFSTSEIKLVIKVTQIQFLLCDSHAMYATSLQLMHNSKVFNRLQLGGCHVATQMPCLRNGGHNSNILSTIPKNNKIRFSQSLVLSHLGCLLKRSWICIHPLSTILDMGFIFQAIQPLKMNFG